MHLVYVSVEITDRPAYFHKKLFTVLFHQMIYHIVYMQYFYSRLLQLHSEQCIFISQME